MVSSDARQLNGVPTSRAKGRTGLILTDTGEVGNDG
jgi:hypothetical protein